VKAILGSGNFVTDLLYNPTVAAGSGAESATPLSQNRVETLTMKGLVAAHG
jgi:hypothetical protein